jgi:hypothetical protein
MTLTVESWIEALESGKYQQGTGQLRNGDCFCCLGVACDLSDAGQWKHVGYVGSDSQTNHYLAAGKYHDSLPPCAVVKLVGLNTDQGDFEPESLPSDLAKELAAVCKIQGVNEIPGCLTELNDDGVPFPLIAKVIRARPKGLFRDDAP